MWILNILALHITIEKDLLFKIPLSLPLHHLIPYYAEIFLASSLLHLQGCGSAGPGSGSLAGSQKDMTASQLHLYVILGLALKPHRKSDL